MTDDRTPFREAREAGLRARHEQRLARTPQRFIVIRPAIVGNLDNWTTEYYWDGAVYPTRARAISGGFKIHGHDDWLIGIIRNNQLVKVAWMDEDRDDAEELAGIAAALSMEVAS